MPNKRTRSEEETIAWGRELAQLLPRRGCVLLIGGLGAGKTALAKGIVSGRGAAPAEEVTSPTFPLIHEFGSRPKIYHIDLYRLETAAEVAAIGIEDLFDEDALVLIEWGERFPELLPARRIEIRLQPAGGDEREITVSEVGAA